MPVAPLALMILSSLCSCRWFMTTSLSYHKQVSEAAHSDDRGHRDQYSMVASFCTERQKEGVNVISLSSRSTSKLPIFDRGY